MEGVANIHDSTHKAANAHLDPNEFTGSQGPATVGLSKQM
jgi:hypothetical protein